jgi:radical SAM/Cys-rich protein
MNEFDRRILETLPEGLSCEGINRVQVNLGRRCNLSCSHCHLECSPLRQEFMTEAVMEKILNLLRRERVRLVDITGGAPELHPQFREFAAGACMTGSPVQVRTNLVALLDKGGPELIEFLRGMQISLVASLPCYTRENVDSQRGAGVYDLSIEAIRCLNDAGYGIEGGLGLTLVYNPGGPFLPAPQGMLEADYREELDRHFGVSFTSLIVLTNMPLGRFRRGLAERRELKKYFRTLVDAFNPATVPHLMCRDQVCIDWDGALYDCDFNLALRKTVNHGAPTRIESFDPEILAKRKVVTGLHCFGCTAGAGSSCSGTLVCGDVPSCR